VQLHRRIVLCVPALLLLAGCSAERMLPAVGPSTETSLLQASVAPTPLTPLVQLDIPTYEGSGQAVHPDVVHFKAAWHSWEYWMVMTPFPLGREAYENPSILVSHDGLKWQLPAGIVNPLARTPGKMGYNSDPDMSYDVANDRLVMLYREVTATQNLIHSIASTDGVHWSKPLLIFQRANHDMVSPTVSMTAAGVPTVWYVEAGPKNCSERVSHVSMQTAASSAALMSTAPEKGWSPIRRNVLVQAGMNIWHIDATWIAERKEYWATYIAYPIHKCAGQDLFFARSADGITWTTYSVPFLRHDAATWTAGSLYRSSVAYDAARDVVQFFVSGSAADKTWHLGYVDYKLTTFLAALENGHPALGVATAAPGDGVHIEP
jgi:hypothetical protein